MVKKIVDFPSKDKDFDEIRLAFVSDKFSGNGKEFTFITVAASHRGSDNTSCMNAMNMGMLIEAIESVGITNVEDLEKIYNAFKHNDIIFTNSLCFGFALEPLESLINKWKEYDRIYGDENK